MAITFRGAGVFAEANSGGTISPALFESPTAGDLLLCLAMLRDGTTDITVAGWSRKFLDIGSAGRTIGLALFYKIAVGGDANPTVVFTGANSGDSDVGQCCAFRGTNQSTIFDQDGTVFNASGAQNIGPITGITPAVSDAAVIVMGAKSDNWTSVATLSGDGLTWNEIGDPSTALGSDAGLVWDYAIISGAPVTVTNKTFTVTGGAINDTIGRMVSIQPPATAAQNVLAWTVA